MFQYQQLVKHVLETGTRKENRTGVDTISTFNYNYEIDLADGFPLLTTKSISWKNIVIEMLWFLSGQTDISILKRHGCKFWDAWADPVSGKVPSAYGHFWREFPVHGWAGTIDHPESNAANDQIDWVLSELRRNPMSRRMVVSAWAPGNAQTSKLPPCHTMFVLNVQDVSPYKQHAPKYLHCNAHNVQPDYKSPVCGKEDGHREGLYLRDGELWCPDCQEILWKKGGAKGFQNPPKDADYRRLCLHLTQRSCDVALGVPYNIASYALLLSIFSHLSGIKPGIFAHTLVDAHIYTKKPDGSMAEYDHIPGLEEQIKREPRALPKLIINPAIKELSDIEALMRPEVTTDEVMRHFKLEGYDPHPAIPFKVAV